jgi:hypothetical protein
MDKRIILTLFAMLLAGAGLVIFLSRSPPEVTSSYITDDMEANPQAITNDAVGKSTGFSSEEKGNVKAPDDEVSEAEGLSNLHGISVKELNHAALSSKSTVLSFSLRRKTKLSIRAVECGGREIVDVLKSRVFPAGKHGVGATAFCRRSEGMRRGSYLIEIHSHIVDGTSQICSPAKRSAWRTLDSGRVRFSHGWSRIEYSLDSPAMVRLRIGLQNGLVLASVVNGEHRGAGRHLDRWRRVDSSGQVKFSKDGSYWASLETAAPPENLLIVELDRESTSASRRLDPKSLRNLPAKLKDEERKNPKERGGSNSRQGDYVAHLELKMDTGKRTSVVYDRGFIWIDLPAARKKSNKPKYQVQVFLDYKEVFTGMTSEFPLKHGRRFDAEREGVHVFSVIIRDELGDLGLASMTFEVRHPK